MNRLMKAYRLKDSDWVVLDKKSIHNTKDEDYEEVSLILSKDQIVGFYEELDMMGELSEEDESA